MQLTPIGGIGQKSFHSVEESHTVTSLLQSLGLGKYNILFRAEEVDMTALKQMGDEDLKDMGMPMGLRKKIRLALWPHSRREQPWLQTFIGYNLESICYNCNLWLE